MIDGADAMMAQPNSGSPKTFSESRGVLGKKRNKVIARHFLRFLAFSLVLAVAIGFPACAENARGSINSLDELFAALRKCWVPPPVARSRDGMEITVRFSVTRYGKVFGKAAIRYESRDASDEERLAYRVAVAQAIERCTPFPITEEFGNAIAGHPLNIKFTDRRKQRQARSRQHANTVVVSR